MSFELEVYVLLAFVLLGVGAQVAVGIVGGRRGWAPRRALLWAGLIGLGYLVVVLAVLWSGLGPTAVLIGAFITLAALWSVGFMFVSKRRRARQRPLGPGDCDR
jgi:hypothetical protein